MTTWTPHAQAVPLNGRKAYGARLSREDVGRTWPTREWLPRARTFNGSKGYFTVVDGDPGWIEVQSTEWGSYTPTRRYYAWTGTKLEPMPGDWHPYIVGAACAGPAPGQPGAWNGDRCVCGQPVTRYTPKLWPWCDECEPTPDPDPDPTPADTGPDLTPF